MADALHLLTCSLTRLRARVCRTRVSQCHGDFCSITAVWGTGQYACRAGASEWEGSSVPDCPVCFLPQSRLGRSLERLRQDALAVENGSEREVDALRDRYLFLRAVYKHHSSAEDEVKTPLSSIRDSWLRWCIWFLRMLRRGIDSKQTGRSSCMWLRVIRLLWLSIWQPIYELFKERSERGGN